MKCSAIFEDGYNHPAASAGDYALEEWDSQILDLNLHTENDSDFFSITIPDPSDPGDGGHDDEFGKTAITSDGSPLEDCGRTTRRNTRPAPSADPIEPVLVHGQLIITIVPIDRQGMRLSEEVEAHLYWDSDGDGTQEPFDDPIERSSRAGRLPGEEIKIVIDCPVSTYDLDENGLVLSVGEGRSGLASGGGAYSFTASPSSGSPGTSVTLNGSGWTVSPVNPVYQISWDSKFGQVMGSFAPAPDGSWMEKVTIPGPLLAQPGIHQIVACEGFGGEFQVCSSEPFTVVSPTATSTPTPAAAATATPTATSTPTPAAAATATPTATSTPTPAAAPTAARIELDIGNV